MNDQYQLTQVNIACMKEVDIDNPSSKALATIVMKLTSWQKKRGFCLAAER